MHSAIRRPDFDPLLTEAEAARLLALSIPTLQAGRARGRGPAFIRAGRAIRYRLVIGRGDYHWQHEPCWYAVRKKGHWTGDRKQTALWTISSRGQDAETEHSTQKPVECMRRPMLNNSAAGQAVYEPFLGSGTTLIAAETIGRTCFGIELEPVYVDVAIRRWQAFTGDRAILLEDGRSFDEIEIARSTSQEAGQSTGEAGA